MNGDVEIITERTNKKYITLFFFTLTYQNRKYHCFYRKTYQLFSLGVDHRWLKRK